MSVLRFLSPARYSRPGSPGPSSRHGSKSRDRFQPRLTIRVPSYGSVFMTPDHQSYAEGSTPVDENGVAGPSTHRADRESRGEIEIEIPSGMGRRRVKSIKVGMRTEVELLIGRDGRGWEKDVIFEKTVDVRGGNPEGIVLEEGIQRFHFTLNLPADLCSHDRHPNGKITHFLFATVEGHSSRSHSRDKGKKSSLSTGYPSAHDSRGRSPLRSGESSPTSSEGTAVNPASLTSALNSMAISRQAPAYQPAPPYGGPVEDVEWLEHDLKKERRIEILYNTHPDGGITELDVSVRDAVQGLGPFEVKLVSDCWTIGGFMIGSAELVAPSPAVTIFAFRVSLIQIHSLLSPRDDPAKTERIRTVQTYPIFTQGYRPASSDKRPGPGTPALWRGKEAGGKQDGVITMEGKGRCPPDSKCRPTSPPNIPTPIEVQHKLAIEILFSVWGEDEAGRPLNSSGPGALRALMIEKNTTIASCAYTPEELRLPSYDTVAPRDAFSHLARTCPLCGRDPIDKLCLTCPPSSIPHPRHDHPPKLVGNDSGICPMCADEVIPKREANFDDCACGMDSAYLEERLRKATAGPRRGESTNERDEELLITKAESERGRRR